MKEITIQYKNAKTLQILKSLSEYFDFKISENPLSKPEEKNIVTIIEGDPTVDISGMQEIFTRLNLDAKELRIRAWQRKK